MPLGRGVPGFASFKPELLQQPVLQFVQMLDISALHRFKLLKEKKVSQFYDAVLLHPVDQVALRCQIPLAICDDFAGFLQVI